MPDSLKQAESPRSAFDDARDPFIRLQKAALKQSEKERRESGDGSAMVKQDKPFPELKPHNDNQPARNAFNQKWANEQRRAQREPPKAQALSPSQDLFEKISAKSPGFDRGR